MNGPNNSTRPTPSGPRGLDRATGPAGFGEWLDAEHISLDPATFDKAYHEVREALDSNGQVDANRLHEIVDRVIADMEVFQGVAASFRAFR